MTTYYSDAVTSDLRMDGLKAGLTYTRSAKYTVVTELAVNDIVQMIPVPDGAMIIDVMLRSDAGTSGGTLDVGIGGDADKFIDGVVITAAVQCNLYGSNSGNAIVTGGAGYIFTADDTIDITVLSQVLAVGKTFDLHVTYKMTDTIADEASVFA